MLVMLQISNDGAAQNCGLRVGDRILQVNDINLRNATHDEAVEALIQPVKELRLEVRHDPTPSGLRVSLNALCSFICVSIQKRLIIRIVTDFVVGNHGSKIAILMIVSRQHCTPTSFDRSQNPDVMSDNLATRLSRCAAVPLVWPQTVSVMVIDCCGLCCQGYGIYNR